MRADNQTRVMIVARYPINRAGLRVLVEGYEGISVVAEVDPEEDVAQVIAVSDPDVILLQADSGEHLNVLEGEDLNKSKAIILSSELDSKIHFEAVRLGVSGLVMKEQPPDTLLRAIASVNDGETWISRSIMVEVLNQLLDRNGPSPANNSRSDALTEREMDVIRQVGQGLGNQEISRRLGISDSTVRHHLTSIYAKLGVSDRLELCVFAYRNNLVKIPS
jgi:DNA-binding NarL/FixJ family response regulator